jgi:two-component system, NtrC family, response regulator AtoC
LKQDTKKIILIDTDPSYLTNLVRSLDSWKDDGVEVHTFTSPANAILFIDKHYDQISVILTDFNLPQVNGLELIDKIDRKDRIYQVIILTGSLNRNLTESFLHMNIFDLLGKSESLPKIAESIKQAHQFHLKKAEQMHRIEGYLKTFRQTSQSSQNTEQDFYGIIGNSREILNLKKQIKKISTSSATCLIVGESGTGKEMIAKSIHEESQRKNEPYVIVNCAAIPRDLIESELFGHKKGSFTGANYDKEGLLEIANGGTVFFDEITELPMDMQPRLLRFLQEGTIQLVGDSITKKLDVRVIAATNRDLEQAVKQNRVRGDLYYRLNVIPIYVPPLRERKADIRQLLEFFINFFCELEKKPLLEYDEEILSYFENYYWPGNIRELRNIVQRMILFSDSNILGIEDIPAEIYKYKDLERKDDPNNTMERPVLSMKEIEKRSIEKALRKANYNKELAAKALGISRASIYRKMKEYGIQ